MFFFVFWLNSRRFFAFFANQLWCTTCLPFTMSRKAVIAVKKQQLKQAKLSEDIQHNFLYFFVYKKVFVHFSVYNKFVCTFFAQNSLSWIQGINHHNDNTISRSTANNSTSNNNYSKLRKGSAMGTYKYWHECRWWLWVQDVFIKVCYSWGLQEPPSIFPFLIFC